MTQVCLSFVHIDGSVRKTPKTSLLKDEEIGIIDKSPSDMDSLLIKDMSFL